MTMKQLITTLLLLFVSSSAMSAMVYDAKEAFCDSYGRVCGDGYAFKINNKNIRGGKTESKEFTIVDNFGFLNVDDSNNAVLMARISNGVKTYDVYAEFNDLSSTPVTNPKKQLKGKAYTEKGGPVDTNTWQYTGNTSTAGWSGYLLDEGTLNDGFQPADKDAATFEFSLINSGFQIGEGANNKNIFFGASAQLQFFDAINGRKRGGGSLNIDLNPQPVPLPDSLPLFLSATAGLVLIGGRKEDSK